MENGVLAAIYVNKMAQRGVDRETAFITLLGTMAARMDANTFAEALQHAYVAIETGEVK